jgi:hypothetical protein
MLDLLSKMESNLEVAKLEAQKFLEKGNASAGTRLRLKMQEFKNDAQEIRKQVSEAKNNK